MTPSTAELLTVMTIIALVFTPILLAYQVWTYCVFRKRISRTDVEAGVNPA